MVRDYYRILAGTASFGFPWKSIWKQKIPSRVAFFVWIAALRKCLTIDNLRKRKVWILNWCYMCKRNGESVDHLFLHCPLASDLWATVLGLFGVSWVMPRTVLGYYGVGKAAFVVTVMVVFGPSFLIAYCGVLDRKSTRLNSSH